MRLQNGYNTHETSLARNSHSAFCLARKVIYTQRSTSVRNCHIVCLDWCFLFRTRTALRLAWKQSVTVCPNKLLGNNELCLMLGRPRATPRNKLGKIGRNNIIDFGFLGLFVSIYQCQRQCLCQCPVLYRVL